VLTQYIHIQISNNTVILVKIIISVLINDEMVSEMVTVRNYDTHTSQIKLQTRLITTSLRVKISVGPYTRNFIGTNLFVLNRKL